MKTQYFTLVVAERAGRKRLELTARKAYEAAVSKLALGEELRMRVESMPRRQGNQVMRWYRGVVIPDIARACGYTDPDDFQSVHEAMAWKFLAMDPHPEFGYPRRRSTSKNDLSAEEMTTYVNQVVEYAESSIAGCRIRRPNEVDLDEIHAVDYDEAA